MAGETVTAQGEVPGACLARRGSHGSDLSRLQRRLVWPRMHRAPWSRRQCSSENLSLYAVTPPASSRRRTANSRTMHSLSETTRSRRKTAAEKTHIRQKVEKPVRNTESKRRRQPGRDLLNFMLIAVSSELIQPEEQWNLAEQGSGERGKSLLPTPTLLYAWIRILRVMWETTAFHWGPRRIVAEFQARSSRSPRFIRLFVRVLSGSPCRACRGLSPPNGCALAQTPLGRRRHWGADAIGPGTPPTKSEVL
jgi:hypothetical protein